VPFSGPAVEGGGDWIVHGRSSSRRAFGWPLTIAEMVGLSPGEIAKLIQKENERGEHRAAEHDRPVAQIETKEANIDRT
jgi:hypothetical protein